MGRVSDQRQAAGRPVVLFDGVCPLCNSFVRFILARDHDAVFRFAPLQSEAALRLLEGAPFAIDPSMSVVLVDGSSYHTETDAVIGILDRLPAAAVWGSIFRVLPKPIRNAVYRFIARRRYALFGRRASCIVPSDDVRERFL